jgi:hypothetical protein
MSTRNLTRSIAAGAVAVAVAVGAYTVGNSSSSSGSSGTANAAPAAQSHQGPRGGQPGQGPGGGQPSQPIGQVPKNWTPGSGTIVTGAAADKAKAAAAAQYPDGTVNRVLQLSDGSYAVHRIKTPAPHHVFVSRDFKVTGAE